MSIIHHVLCSQISNSRFFGVTGQKRITFLLPTLSPTLLPVPGPTLHPALHLAQKRWVIWRLWY
jgi:hypothetical protein